MTKENKNKYITVLDFEDGNVYQYDIHGVVDKYEQEITQSEQMEEYLTMQGHNLSNCEWMVHNNKGINGGYIPDDIQVIINGHRYKIS